MSNKKIPSTESVSTVDQDSSVLNGTATSPLKSSPLFGWLYAGSDLLSAKLDHAAGVVSQKIDDTQETINSMQAKGLEVESELRRTLNPFALVDAAQKLVVSTPLFSAFSGGQKRQQKEQQLELLSAKVDLLVEQVALLAAKEAAKKAEAKSAASKTAAPKNTSPKSTQATRSTSTKSSSTASSTPRTRKASTTKSAAASSSTTKKASAGTTNKRTAAKSTTTKSAAQKKAASAEATSTKSATDTTKNDE
ncbi:hypothetical protein ACD631_12790 [Alteromonas macleodii]|uniref:hypothetical protein n=1 Tax=Alteromonas macleodii TaxID=28108 RepID=UPI0020767FC8|nr:hypothetical protein [Alteromonas macleodii]USI27249.1 hypothetical protein NFG60_16255 [Alteromonas macleodii]